tara:strand:+ start:1267 stop:1698 length:432 start_codon:yes stop_codon:yes gene_type:complete
MDQKKIFNPKIWLTLFAVAHTFAFALWALMAGFASDAEIVEWLIEDGLPTDQIVVDEMKSAMFFLGVMAISIVPPFIATAFLLEGRPQAIMTLVCGGTMAMMWLLAMYGDVSIDGKELGADQLLGAVFAGAILYSGYLHLEDE